MQLQSVVYATAVSEVIGGLAGAVGSPRVHVGMLGEVHMRAGRTAPPDLRRTLQAARPKREQNGPRRSVRAAAGEGGLLAPSSSARESTPSGAKSTPAVLVVGAGGRTGRAIVQYCAARGFTVRAGTRDGTLQVNKTITLINLAFTRKC
jgi:hypothetical protein